jgi:hypothetical protein
MLDPEDLLQALASVGSDCAEALGELKPPFPDTAFWNDELAAAQLWASCSADVHCVARGVREMLINIPGKMDVATLYFHMLSSKEAPVCSTITFA